MNEAGLIRMNLRDSACNARAKVLSLLLEGLSPDEKTGADAAMKELA